MIRNTSTRILITLLFALAGTGNVNASLLDDPDGIFGTLHLNGDPANLFAPNEIAFPGAGSEFMYSDNDFAVDVDFMDESVWLTLRQFTANALPWEIWLEDLDWGVPGEITSILVPTMPPFTTTFTANSIHIRYDPAAQGPPPPGPGIVIEDHIDFAVRHIPEPATLALCVTAIGLVAVTRRLRG